MAKYWKRPEFGVFACVHCKDNLPVALTDFAPSSETTHHCIRPHCLLPEIVLTRDGVLVSFLSFSSTNHRSQTKCLLCVATIECDTHRSACALVLHMFRGCCSVDVTNSKFLPRFGRPLPVVRMSCVLGVRTRKTRTELGQILNTDENDKCRQTETRTRIEHEIGSWLRATVQVLRAFVDISQRGHSVLQSFHIRFQVTVLINHVGAFPADLPQGFVRLLRWQAPVL